MFFLGMLFTFICFGFICLNGGGSLLQFYIDELVINKGWLTMEELGDLMAISQVTPGPIGVNMATFIGYEHGGVLGGLLTTIGLLAPSFFLMTLALKFYDRYQDGKVVRSLLYGVKPITTSLICTALFACLGLSIFTTEIPIGRWIRELMNLENPEAPDFGVYWQMLPVLVFSCWALGSRKLTIMGVIFSSAALGAVMTYFFG